MNSHDDLASVWSTLVSHVQRLKGHVGPIEYKETKGAGRGLFLTEDIEVFQPHTSLVVIPRRALINTRTLPSDATALKKALKLNSTQALSLHLCLVRHCVDEVFPNVYMASLPRTFDEHPLTWLASESTSGPGPRIFESLPPSAKRAIHEAYKRYVHDLEVVKTALKSSTETATIDNHDFLWAWLCVNTRCIHYSLNNADRTRSLKDIDLTLCPIIDFANHTIKEELTAQVIRNGNSALEFFSAGTAMKKGDEIFLRYGNHNNAVLLAEYGFTISRSEQPSKLAVGENDTVDGGEINVDDVIEMLFEEKSGQWRKDILKSRGYWGDWTLHSSPTPAHPSYRILPALRLLHLSQPTPDEEAVLGSWTDAASNLNAWEMMVLGRQQTVSHQNELSVSGTMRVVCERVMARGEHGLNELYELEQSILTLTPEASGDTDWFSSTIRCATILWKEEYEVANAVLESIERGDPLE